MGAKERDMRRSTRGAGLGLMVLSIAGCQTAGTAGLRLLRLVSLQQQPLVIAVTPENQPAAAADALNPFPRYVALQQALGKTLGRPVSMDVCFPFQVPLGFASGWHQAALVPPLQYAQMAAAGAPRVLAVPVDAQGRQMRCGLLVVAADSAIQNVDDLRGRTVAFGPADDARTHQAALLLLREAGLQPTDLVLEVLPVPGSLKHMPHMRAVAQTVMHGSSDAGFIDEAAWESFPAHADDAGEPARDRLRIVARTIAVPDRLVLAAPQLDEASAAKLRSALLEVSANDPAALAPLGYAGFQVPRPEVLAACEALAAFATPPAPETEADEPDDAPPPASAPALPS
jgi:phosphonate transport system substrate-binding protein